ncbi:Kunitz/Bovine pancreatic trypsin inhibitor domain protein, partial [Ancylostoma caninum]
MEASWIERFYWNAEKTECEPFWYDSTCDPKDVIGKNFFESLESCQKSCPEDAAVPTEAFVEQRRDEVTSVGPPKALTEGSGDLTTTIPSPRRTFSAEDPFGLLERQQTADVRRTTQALAPSHRQEVSNFVAKTPIELFDRKKYMEEFKKKLTALPEGYVRTSLAPEDLQTFETVKRLEDGTKSTSQPMHFEAGKKTLEKFDRKKFMEEFKKKLNALPDDYMKGTTATPGAHSSNIAALTPTTKEKPFTLQSTSDTSSGHPTSEGPLPLQTSREIGIEKF